MLQRLSLRVRETQVSSWLQRVQTVTSLHTQQKDYPLPWPQSLKPTSPHSTPFWNRVAGLYLLSQFVDFSRSEFLLGVKDAVHTIAGAISNKSRHSELDYLLTKRLCDSIKPSLESLPEDASIHLDIESLRHLQLCTVHGKVGEAPQDDVFAVKILGQDIVSSETKLQTYSDAFFRGSKEDRMAAGDAVLTLRATFEIGVSFTTIEKYVVFGGDGQVLDGSNQFTTCNHYWKFRSPVDCEREGEFPLDWTVSDINSYLDIEYQ